MSETGLIESDHPLTLWCGTVAVDDGFLGKDDEKPRRREIFCFPELVKRKLLSGTGYRSSPMSSKGRKQRLYLVRSKLIPSFITFRPPVILT